MTPALCTLLATSVTEVRRTPSISARNSCVKPTGSLPARSALCNSQRQNRASIECSALQAAVTRACDSNTSLYRMQRLRRGSLAATAGLERGGGVLLQTIGLLTATANSDFYRASPGHAPTTAPRAA